MFSTCPWPGFWPLSGVFAKGSISCDSNAEHETLQKGGALKNPDGWPKHLLVLEAASDVESACMLSTACALLTKVIMAKKEKSKDDGGKKAGGLPCLACKAKSGSVPWGESIRRNSGRLECIGNRCLACMRLWNKAFSYLSWEHYASMIQTEETVF